MACLDKKHVQKPFRYLEIKPCEGNVVKLISGDGLILVTTRLENKELSKLLNGKTFYIHADQKPVFTKLCKLKFDTLETFLDKSSIVIEGQIIELTNLTNYPNMSHLIKSISEPIKHEISFNFYHLQKICKSLERKDTKNQIITFKLPKNKNGLITIKKNDNQYGFLAPIRSE